jgi:hypothetical protein
MAIAAQELTGFGDQLEPAEAEEPAISDASGCPGLVRGYRPVGNDCQLLRHLRNNLIRTYGRRSHLFFSLAPCFQRLVARSGASNGLVTPSGPFVCVRWAPRPGPMHAGAERT